MSSFSRIEPGLDNGSINANYEENIIRVLVLPERRYSVIRTLARFDLGTFLLRGCRKVEIYGHYLRSPQILNKAIETEICSILQEIFGRITQNFTSRMQQYLENNGHHLTDIIFLNLMK